MIDVDADQVLGVATVTLPHVVCGSVIELCCDVRDELDCNAIAPLDRSKLSAVLAMMSELLVTVMPAPVMVNAPTVVLVSPVTDN